MGESSKNGIAAIGTVLFILFACAGVAFCGWEVIQGIWNWLMPLTVKKVIIVIGLPCALVVGWVIWTFHKAIKSG